MLHVHLHPELEKWIIRPTGGKLILYSGSKIMSIIHAIFLSKENEIIAIHRKNGTVQKII